MIGEPVIRCMFIYWGGTLKNYRVCDQNNLETVGLVNARSFLGPLI